MSPAADPNDPNPFGVRVVPIEHAERSRADRILGTVESMIADFLYYDRKEDEDLPRGEIEAAVEAGEVTVDQIVEQFSTELRKHL
jgi:hypothetical protein